MRLPDKIPRFARDDNRVAARERPLALRDDDRPDRVPDEVDQDLAQAPPCVLTARLQQAPLSRLQLEHDSL